MWGGSKSFYRAYNKLITPTIRIPFSSYCRKVSVYLKHINVAYAKRINTATNKLGSTNSAPAFNYLNRILTRCLD